MRKVVKLDARAEDLVRRHMVRHDLSFDAALNELVRRGGRPSRRPGYQPDSLEALVVERELEDLEERSARYDRRTRVLNMLIPVLAAAAVAFALAVGRGSP